MSWKETQGLEEREEQLEAETTEKQRLDAHLVARQEVPLCTECVEGSQEESAWTHKDAQTAAARERARRRWHDKK